MEELYRTHVQPANPRETAGRLSRIVFYWLLPLFRLGRKRPLNIEDIYTCPSWEVSKSAGDRLETEWNEELAVSKTTGRSPSLARALFRIHGRRMILLAFLPLIQECGKNILLPIGLGHILSYLRNPDQSWMSYEQFVGFTIFVAILNCAHIFTYHPFYYFMGVIGMRIRVACCSLLYRKSLRLSQASLSTTASGQMINLMSNDVRFFDTSLFFIPYLIIAPLQGIIIMALLYMQVGWPSLCCLVYVLIWIPLQYCIGRKIASIRGQTADLTDRRVRFVYELISSLRAIKMYAWERPFGAMLSEIRRQEIGRIRLASMLRGVNVALYFVTPKVMLFFICVLFAFVDGGTLTPERIFVPMAFFNVMRISLGVYFPYIMGQGLEIRVPLRRMETFLLLEERTLEERRTIADSEENVLEMKNVKASWATDTETVKSHLTLNGINLNVKSGELVIVAGPVGSGKTSLIMAILGELPLSTGRIAINGTIGYASQVPWLFAGSLKRNVCLNNSTVDEAKFRHVVDVCALAKDLELLPAAAETFVGDKGSSLSGGQKARVGLARAVYHDADLYLLDDPLSAVDANVSQHIFSKCIQHLRDKGKAVLLVTHQLQYAQRADRILLLGANGTPIAYGSYDEIVKSGVMMENLLGKQNEAEDGRFDDNSIRRIEGDKGTLSRENVPKNDVVVAKTTEQTEEDRGTGTVSVGVYWKYLYSGGGWFVLGLLVISSLGFQVLYNGTDFWLNYWLLKVGQTHGQNVDFQQLSWLVYVYSGLIGLLVVASFTRSLTFFEVCMKASVRLHDGMATAIMRAPISFSERNPIGRIQNRFTKDLGTIDEVLPMNMEDWSFSMINVVGAVVAVAIVSPLMIPPSLVLLCVIIFLWRFYINAIRDLRRLEGVTRSPVFSHVSSSLFGLASIRAYRVEPAFADLFDLFQDRHTSTFSLILCSVRWFGASLDLIVFVYISTVTITFTILGAAGAYGFTGGDVGLVIANAILLTDMFQWAIRQTAEVESQMTSVERVLDYCSLQPEAPLETHPDHRPPDGWPSKGGLTLRNVSLCYFPDQPAVLNDLNCDIRPGEKIGVIGRTGAGKSSIIAALFRLYEPSGDILIDGVATKTLGLHKLRTSIGIIPQDPALFAGSLRRNLDPFNEKTDEELWMAVDEAALKSELADGLDTIISEQGSNLSTGQKQLVCLARAIVRRCKLLVLDEATANVDSKTDDLIQETIRRSFRSATVLTIAHRLHTVMDSDRIMVLEAGKIVEFAEPYKLLLNPRSTLSYLVDRTGSATASHLRNLANLNKKNE